MLFKLDSPTRFFIEKVFGRKLNGNRTKYLELLAETSILNEFPAVNQHGDVCVHRSELVAAGSKLTRIWSEPRSQQRRVNVQPALKSYLAT